MLRYIITHEGRKMLERKGFKLSHLLLCKVLFVVVLSFMLLIQGSGLAFADENQASDANQNQNQAQDPNQNQNQNQNINEQNQNEQTELVKRDAELTPEQKAEYMKQMKEKIAKENPDWMVSSTDENGILVQAAVILGTNKKPYGQYYLATQTINYRNQETGEVIGTIIRRVVWVGTAVDAQVPPSLVNEQPMLKITRFIDEDGNDVKDVDATGFVEKLDFIYGANGQVAYKYKNTLLDTEDVRTHVYEKVVIPNTTTPPTPAVPQASTGITPKVPQTPAVKTSVPNTFDGSNYFGYLGISVMALMSAGLLFVSKLRYLSSDK